MKLKRYIIGSIFLLNRVCFRKPKMFGNSGNVFQKSIDLDKRPKWGVNRPEVQYIKQSAKDPNYQLKLRQKLLWNRRISNANSASSCQPDINERTR